MAVAYGARPLGIDDEWITGDGSFLECSWCIRTRHLLKTFYAGPRWLDGTVIVTSPIGRTYTTHPGCRIFFPTCHITTADLPPPAEEAPSAGRGLMMPRRKRTRAADYARRIKRGRALNDAYIAERNKPPPF